MSVLFFRFSPTLMRVCTVGLLALSLLPPAASAAAEVNEYLRQANDTCQQAETAWRSAGMPGEGTVAGDALLDAAIHADRPDLFEQVTAQGDPLQRMLPIPKGSRRMPLRVLHHFAGFQAQFSDEMFASIRWRDDQHGWLARRLTRDAIEVWTSKHGWLFDGRGRLLHEARPVRQAGLGREWYGAFLPDGRWITTDLEEMDGVLRFYSTAGKELRALTCEQLAPRPQDGGSKLIGWARSDRQGASWVVNVGSEGGWATVAIAPEGPAHVLRPGDKWALCYPRALGPRGLGLGLTVPDDSGRFSLDYGSASHGSGVGFPSYRGDIFEKDANQEPIQVRLAGGSEVFGFWPGKTSIFIGAESTDPREASGIHTRKLLDYAFDNPARIIDKTWFFDPQGHLQSWLRARRIGDAADGRSMLFRVTADSRVMTLGPDLRVKAMRRFVWQDGRTADALILWDDLRLGLFVRHDRLFLAAW